MKPKPRALTWLEEQTGEEISYEPSKPADTTRHLSVRLPVEDALRLEQIAVRRSITFSQTARTILASALDEHAELADLAGPDLAARLAADVAEVQRRLAS